jgi:hypothetical protein
MPDLTQQLLLQCIHAQNLLLASAQDDSAIMMATHTCYSLQLIVESFSMRAQQVSPSTICNHSFKLIDALASEGALFAPSIFEDAFTYTNEMSHAGAWAQGTFFLVSKLIGNDSKMSLHFQEDCGIFLEGEWEVKDNGNAFVKKGSAYISNIGEQLLSNDDTLLSVSGQIQMKPMQTQQLQSKMIMKSSCSSSLSYLLSHCWPNWSHLL